MNHTHTHKQHQHHDSLLWLILGSFSLCLCGRQPVFIAMRARSRTPIINFLGFSAARRLCDVCSFTKLNLNMRGGPVGTRALIHGGGADVDAANDDGDGDEPSRELLRFLSLPRVLHAAECTFCILWRCVQTAHTPAVTIAVARCSHYICIALHTVYIVHTRTLISRAR